MVKALDCPNAQCQYTSCATHAHCCATHEHDGRVKAERVTEPVERKLTAEEKAADEKSEEMAEVVEPAVHTTRRDTGRKRKPETR